jgi:7-cyano-7-deazaguanine synthase
MARNPAGDPRASAVLFSGGLDSAVLLALERRDHDLVWPIHVRAGLAWEDAEARAIATLLAHGTFRHNIAPLTTLAVDMRDTYTPDHWAVEGRPPAYDTPDEAVYLEGRNLVLIAKAAVFCAGRVIGRLTLGPLAGNPG